MAFAVRELLEVEDVEKVEETGSARVDQVADNRALSSSSMSSERNGILL